MKKRIWGIVGVTVLAVALLVSLGFNVYTVFWGFDSYLQSTEQIYIMEAGILRNYLDFAKGEDLALHYDFENEAFPQLVEMYGIEEVAGTGTEFERALRLMNTYAPRLRHKSDYDNSVEMNALALLAYSLDNKNQGINCRNKAQILNEMCLALGIYSRKVWIMPNSGYDNDCHVVNEIWDTSLNKWIMLDITNNEYWVDENGTPLSVLEIRDKGALREFCTPVQPNDRMDRLEKLKDQHIGDFLYIMKNMVYMEYCGDYTTGESDTIYALLPENLNSDYAWVISREACERSPLQDAQ